jgi:glycosyltransferase involved in cell wall biosynthesis
MRAVIDCRPALDPRRTGVGHYADRIVRHLPRADPESQYIAWYLHARGLIRPRRFFAGVPGLGESAARFPARVFEPTASRLGVPKLEWLCGGFDVVLATNFLPPATTRPGVVMVVHDLAFDRFPETAPHADVRWHRMLDRWLERAARVIVPSRSTRDDLVDGHPVAPNRVEVVPHGADSAFHPASPDEVARTRNAYAIRERYALFLGGIEPRKNLDGLVRAFARTSGHASLVIAGGPVRWFPSAAQELDSVIRKLPESARSRVVVTGYVSESEKRSLLTGATLLAYPSLYEGFGFPVLEGFAAGVPVLAASVSSLPEVAGDAAALVDPGDETAIADGLERLFEDEELRKHLVAAGRERLPLFTWEGCARRTAEVLRTAARAA